jgi:hypothetical protein
MAHPVKDAPLLHLEEPIEWAAAESATANLNSPTYQ